MSPLLPNVRLPIEHGVLGLDAGGMSLELWFLAPAVRVPWTNVEFIHVVPSVRHSDSGWKTFDGRHITRESLRDGLRFYTIEPVLRDRHAVLGDRNLLVRLWLTVRFLLKPLQGADDRPDPKRGCMR